MSGKRSAQRNFGLMIIEGAIFWSALSFVQGDTVVSMFMNTMTGSVALAGIAATFRQFSFLLGQFIIGTFIHKIEKQSRFMVAAAFISRPLILLMTPFLLMGMNGQLAAWMFIALYALFFLGDGFVGLIWVEIGARTLDSRRRGMAMAINPAVGGFIGIFIALYLRRVLGGVWTVNQQYAFIFGCAGTLLLIDAVVLSFLKDAPHGSRPKDRIIPLIPYVRQLLQIFWRDKSVRGLTVARMLYMLTLVSSSINILYGGSVGLNKAQLVLMPVIGQVAAGFLWSQVSRVLSYPIMMLMGQLVGVLGGLMNIICLVMVALGYSPLVPLSLAMILVSMNSSAYIGYTQHMISLVDEEDKRPLYYVMTALVTAPLTLGYSIAALVAEKFGYLPVYLVVLLAGTAGAVMVYAKFIRKKTG